MATETRPARARRAIETRRRWVAILTTFALVLGITPVLTFASLAATATSAEAATVTVPPTEAKIRDLSPKSGNCVRYAPRESGDSSEWVSSPDTAWGAHGRGSDGCPNSNGPANIGSDGQSAIGFQPSNVTAITTGVTFNIGRMVHSNRVIYSGAETTHGVLELDFAGVLLDYDWKLWETDNDARPCPVGPNNVKCEDEVVFTGQVDETTFTVDGLTYTLVIEGFRAPASGNACPATPSGTAVNQFLTAEGKRTYGCLYGTVQQVRPLTVIKEIASPFGVGAPDTTFDFTTASSLVGTTWGSGFELTVPGESSKTGGYTTGSTLTISETAPGDPWSFAELKCVDGTGAALPGAVDARSFTLNAETAPAVEDAAAAPITCTYTNEYRPTATLTLVKDVDSAGQPSPVAVASDWTLSATRAGTPATALHGASGASAITSATVPAGTYTLGEAATGANTGGYAQDGPWQCTGATVSTNGGVSTVDLAAGDSATCTVRNEFRTGSVTLTKTVTGEGYTGGTEKDFTVDYTCTAPAPDTRELTGTATINPNATNGQAGASVTIEDVPAGYTCAVTEDAPSGGLTNTSWSWGTPSISYEPGSAVVTAGENVAVSVTNPTAQQTGSIAISKAIAPRDGVPAGYVGEVGRTFDYTYTCAIGTDEVASGSGNLSTAGASTHSGIPATSVCTITEATPSPMAGDFADASYAWDGNSGALVLAPVPADGTAAGTVTNYYTRTMASLRVTKSVTGEGYIGEGAPFEVVVQCGSGESAISHTVNLSASGPDATASVPVPAGVACSVAETTPLGDALLAEQYAWNDPTYTGLSAGAVTVAAGEVGSVTITNSASIDKGRISVTKAIESYGDVVPSGTEFTASLTCGSAEPQPITLTWNGANSTTWTSELMPVGTECEVVETALPSGALPGASYAWGAIPAAETVTVGAETAVVTITNDITRVRAPFTVVKDLTKPDPAPSNGTFSGTYSCSYGDDAAVTGTWTAPAAGGAATMSPAASVLVGSTCTVTETDPAAPADPSYTWTVTVPGATTIDADGASATVANTLTRATGSFSVAKSVTGGEEGTAFAAGTAFTFAYSCTDASEIDHTGTLTVPVGDSASVSDIPGGSTCTVTENADPASIDPYRWDGVTFSGASGSQDGRSYTFTTPDGGEQVAVTATNGISARTGSVTVAKELSGETDGFVGGSETDFPVTLTCDGVNYGTKGVTAGGSVTFDGIPLGADCTASEGAVTGGLANGSFGWGTPVISEGVTVNTEDGSSGTITVTNPIERRYAPIALTKDVQVGDHTGVIDPAATYSGTWTCTYEGPGGTVSETGTWSGLDATANDGGAPASLSGVPAGGVLIGSTCQPTEDELGAPAPDPSYSWAAPTLTPVTVNGGEEIATMAVVNTLARATGDLTVTKKVTGETAGLIEGTVFPMTATCSNPDSEGVETFAVSVAAGQTDTLASGVPAGWTCEIAEGIPTRGGEATLVDASYAWGSRSFVIDDQVATSVAIEAGSDHEITVTNEIVRITGGLSIEKAIGEGTPALSQDAAFSGTFTCGEGDGATQGTWSVTGSGAATLDPDIAYPIGTTCKVTVEDELGANEFLPDTSWAWTAADLGSPATITEDGEATITVTNTATRVYTDLTVTKDFTGAAEALVDGAQVTGSWICYAATSEAPFVGGGNLTAIAAGTWTLPASGGSATLATADPNDEGSNVPAESQCLIREDTPGSDLLVHPSFAWTAPSYEPVGQTGLGDVTTVAGEAVGVTLTNSTQRVTGEIVVTKKIERTDAAQYGILDSGLTFTGTYSCQLGEGEAKQGDWGPIAEGETARIDGILLGSSCVIAENEPPTPVRGDPSFLWIAPDHSTVEVGAEPTEVTVTNTLTRVVGSFAVSKRVAGDADGYNAGDTFTFTWECTAPNGDEFPADGPGAFTIAAGEDWNAPNSVPVGSECEVIETELAEPNHGSYEWSTTHQVVTGATASEEIAGATAKLTVGEGDQVVMATFTNTLTRTPGDFTVTKTSDPASGTTVNPGDEITYTVTITPVGAGFVENVAILDDLKELADHVTLNEANFNVGSGKATRDGNQIRWTIPRVDAEDGELVFTYTVTVNEDAHGVTIRNLITTPKCEDGVCSTRNPTPAWTVSKTSDPADGSSVEVGSEVTYTLTARNTSDAVVSRAVVLDDLTDVLDNATLNEPPAEGLSIDGNQLQWRVPEMEPGGEVSVSYTVTVKDDARGEWLRNVVTPGTPGGECATDCETEHPIAGWTLAKSVLAGEGGVAAPGDVVGYTLTATNTSEATVSGAVATDDLSGVLPHGALIEPLPDGLTFDGESESLRWTIPDLAPGEVAAVTYQVTVSEDARGVVLRNVVVPEGPGGVCEEDACTTQTPTPGWTLTKSNDPGDGEKVAPGDTVTYTLTVVNDGESALTGASVLDDLADVLDDSTLVEPLADGLTFDADLRRLTWAVPDVAPGEETSVSYAVTVNEDAAAVLLHNVATPDSPGGLCSGEGECETTNPVPMPFTPQTGETPDPEPEPTPEVTPSATPPVTPEPTSSPAPPTVAGMPVTGASITTAAVIAGLLLLGGAIALGSRRRIGRHTR